MTSTATQTFDEYLSQHDDSNTFLVRRRQQVLAQTRQTSAAYHAQIDRETIASMGQAEHEARQRAILAGRIPAGGCSPTPRTLPYPRLLKK